MKEREGEKGKRNRGGGRGGGREKRVRRGEIPES